MLTEIRIVLVALACALLSGCYVMQAASGEMQVLDQRRPIGDVIADPDTPQEVRTTLEQVSAAREFASRELGLPDNRSYRTYSDVHRTYVVWNVVAAPEFSLEPKHWCFPVAGCVAYRGYFHEHSAQRLAAHLRSQGYDVLVDGVPAYSTLGRFADPVLNTMLGYGGIELAAIIFHELAHQLVYVPGDSSFNEAFATTVQEEGLRRWLRDDPGALKRYQAASARDREYLQLFRRSRDQLSALYASGAPAEVMRERKRAILGELADSMRELERRQGVPSPYRDWLEQGLNNAELVSLATYYDCVPGFERLLQKDGGDLPRFYADVRVLAREPKAQRDAGLCEPPPKVGTAAVPTDTPAQRSMVAR